MSGREGLLTSGSLPTRPSLLPSPRANPSPVRAIGFGNSALRYFQTLGYKVSRECGTEKRDDGGFQKIAPLPDHTSVL